MALQVWLPLNKNGADKNQGLANISVDNSAVYSDSGKLGGCYFYKDGLCQSFNNNLTSIIGEKRSICVWVKPAGNHIHYTGAIVSSGNWNSSNWTFGVNSDNTGVTGFGSGYSQYLSCNVPVNEWTHLTCVTNGTHHDIYKNGSYIGSLTSGNSLLYSDASNTTIGRETYAGGYFGFNGYINDVRIYDHCLSPKEVKEISRGIVLHYKMCQPERSENLLSNWCNITKWTSEGVSQVSVESDSKFNKILTFTPSSGTMRIYYSTSNVWTTNGATFTVSGYVKSSSASTIRFSRSIADYGADVATTTSWKKFSTVITLTSTSTTGTLSIQGSSEIKYYLANLKLERGTNPDPQWSPAPSDNPNWGTIEYDGSGFKNHGTVSGNVTLSADSPRYTGSYKFGTNNYITTTSTGNYIKSATFWAKDAGSVPRDGLVFRDQNSGLAFGIQSGNLITGAVGGPAGSSSVPVSVSDAKYTANTWHFFACVNDNGTHRLYMDGMQISTGTGTGNWSQGSPTNSLNVGGRAGSSYWPGYISDFKMYVTVLSAIDVQELYKLGRV